MANLDLKNIPKTDLKNTSEFGGIWMSRVNDMFAKSTCFKRLSCQSEKPLLSKLCFHLLMPGRDAIVFVFFQGRPG